MIHQAHLYIVDIFVFLLVIIHRNLQKVNNLRVILRDLREMVFLTVKNKQAGLLSHVYLNFPFFLFSLQQFCNNKISTIYIFYCSQIYLSCPNIIFFHTLLLVIIIISCHQQVYILFSRITFHTPFFATTNISSLLFFAL